MGHRSESVEAAQNFARAILHGDHDHLVRAFLAMRGNDQVIAVGQELRVMEIHLAGIDGEDEPRIAAARGDLIEPPAKDGEVDFPVPSPGATVADSGSRDRTNKGGLPGSRRPDPDLSIHGEAEAAALRRPDRIIGPVGAWNLGRLETAQVSDPEPAVALVRNSATIMRNAGGIAPVSYTHL